MSGVGGCDWVTSSQNRGRQFPGGCLPLSACVGYIIITLLRVCT